MQGETTVVFPVLRGKQDTVIVRNEVFLLI